MSGIEIPEGYQEWSDEEFRQMIEDITERRRQENSHRTNAIVCGVDLEQALGELLLAFLVKEKPAVELVNRSDFNRRIELTYCMGLISYDEWADLHLIRKVRNHFAHRPEGATFDDPEVAGHCSQLRILKKGSFEDPSRNSLFASASVVMLELLHRRLHDAGRSRRQPLPEIDPTTWSEL